MRKEQPAAQGQAGAVLPAGVLGCGVIALYGGLAALACTSAQLASPDHGAALSGAWATASTVLIRAGVPAGVTALAVGVNAASRIRARRQAGYPEVTAGWLSGAVGLVAYAATVGLQVLAALYYDG